MLLHIAFFNKRFDLLRDGLSLRWVRSRTERILNTLRKLRRLFLIWIQLLQKASIIILKAIDLYNIIELFSLLHYNSKERKIWRRRKKTDIEISAANKSELATNCDHLVPVPHWEALANAGSPSTRRRWRQSNCCLGYIVIEKIVAAYARNVLTYFRIWCCPIWFIENSNAASRFDIVLWYFCNWKNNFKHNGKWNNWQILWHKTLSRSWD